VIQKAVDKFIKKKDLLFNEGLPDCYCDIVKDVINLIKDEDDDDLNFDDERITLIDHGHYQGNQLFIIACDEYQPEKYWFVKVDYGSCSLCDTLEGIKDMLLEDEEDEGYRDVLEEAKRQLRVLALHIVQKLKLL